jgi:hypothetical protein
VVVKCCQVPRRSANLKSISLIPLSFINEVTSDGVISNSIVRWVGVGGIGQACFRLGQRAQQRFGDRSLESPIPAFFRSNPDNFQEILYKDFTIASSSGPRALLYCSYGRTKQFVSDDEFHF